MATLSQFPARRENRTEGAEVDSGQIDGAGASLGPQFFRIGDSDQEVDRGLRSGMLPLEDWVQEAVRLEDIPGAAVVSGTLGLPEFSGPFLVNPSSHTGPMRGPESSNRADRAEVTLARQQAPGVGTSQVPSTSAFGISAQAPGVGSLQVTFGISAQAPGVGRSQVPSTSAFGISAQAPGVGSSQCLRHRHSAFRHRLGSSQVRSTSAFGISAQAPGVGSSQVPIVSASATRHRSQV